MSDSGSEAHVTEGALESLIRINWGRGSNGRIEQA
jgi:hypothetical protein